MNILFFNLNLIGISITELWKNVEEDLAENSDSIQFDEDIRNWCWNNFLESEFLDIYVSSDKPKMAVDRAEGYLSLIFAFLFDY